MTDSELQPLSPAAPDTFCVYLAKQFVAKRGFEAAAPPEAALLTAQSDIVLRFSDGMTLTIIAMIDRDAHPGKGFTIKPDELKAIGKACLHYCGRVNGTRMPVMIHLIEAGPGSADQQSRLSGIKPSSLFSKAIPAAWVADTAAGALWDTAGFRGRAIRKFIEGSLRLPREAVIAPAAVAVAPSGFPVLTVAILAVLVAMFAVELQYGIGAAKGRLEPTILTLIALGGLSKNLVLMSGEWYRLLSAPFLHAGADHLVMNAIALFIGGRALEVLVGRAWFGAVYVIGALGGSLLSLALNPVTLVSVGASGAIMAVFAAMLVISLHFPAGAIRTGLQMNAIYVLIPSLLPLASVFQGQHVDYAAHFGGAIGGAAVGAIILAIWSNNEAWPAWRRVAGAVAIAGLLALAYPATAIPRNFPAMAFSSQLIPANIYPSSVPSTEVALDLLKRYPRDPRAHMLRATQLLRTNDLPGVEREARAGLAEEDLWHSLLAPSLPTVLRVMLAYAIADNRRDEALTLARPICDTVTTGTSRQMLDSRRLCTN